MNVLVLAAHPDDEVLGLGGTIAWHTKYNYDNVYVQILTEGCSAQYEDYTDIIIKRKSAAIKACEYLGVKDLVCSGLPDMKLETYAHIELNKIIEAAIYSFNPDIVYTHFPDINIDHYLIYKSTIVATRPTPDNKIKKILTYPTISATEWASPININSFIPNVFVNIENTLEDKIKAFSFYDTELRDYPHPRNTESIKIYAKQCGITVGLKAAESFMLIREINR